MRQWHRPSVLKRITRHLLVAVICAAFGTGLLFPLPSFADNHETTIRMALGGLPTRRGNPFRTSQTPTSTVVSAIYDTLTWLENDGSVIPWLATSWRNVDDLTWEFTLRDDVTFSNGTPFGADDVEYMVKYIAGDGPPTEDLRRELEALADARATGPYTVEITTKRSMPLFPRLASIMPMVDPAAWQAMGPEAYQEQPIGTGPFIAQEWTPSSVTMTAFKDSWRAPKADHLEILAIGDPTARIQAFQSDRIDISMGTDPDQFDAVRLVDGTIADWQDGMVISLLIRTDQDNPLADVRVRQALNMAVDRQAIVDVLLDGRTVLASQPATRSAFGFDPSLEPYPYDPEAARALIAEAGYPDGFTFTMETGIGAALVQRVADDLSRIGVTMEVQMRPVMAFLSDFTGGRMSRDGFMLSWTATPVLDATQAVALHSCLKPRPWYCDQTIMPTIMAAMGEWDTERAIDLRHQVMRYYRDQAPGIYLHESVGFAALSNRVSGFKYTYGKILYDQIEISN